MISRLKEIVSGADNDGHMREVVRGTFAALAIRTFGTLLGFTVSLLIARLIGAEGSGIYYLAIAILSIVSTVSRLGFDNTLVRFIASNATEHNWVSIQHIFRIVTRLVGTASLVLAGVLLVLSGWAAIHVFDKPAMRIPLMLVAAMLVPFSLSITTAEALRGLRRISECQLIKTVLISLVTLVVLIPLVKSMQVNGAITAYTIATVLTAIVSWYLWRAALSNAAKKGSGESSPTTLRQLLHSSWPLFGAALTGVVMQHAATVSLGIWQGAVEVGQFNVAGRISSLLIFPLIAMISILAPKFSALHTQQLHKDLELLAVRSTNILTVISIPIAVVVSINAEAVLSLFGPEFVEGVWVLRILLIGMVVNVATGPVSNVLIMSGNEKSVRFAMIFGAGIVVLLCFIFVPEYGAIGAAAAACAGSSLQNSLLAVFVKRKLGFWTIGIARR